MSGVSVSATKMDQTLHEDRVDEAKRQRTFKAPAKELPDGTIVAMGECACLKWNGAFLTWSLAGYVARVPVASATELTVLTPRSTILAMQAGYRPRVHPSGALFG